jgi:hypothetical protein
LVTVETNWQNGILLPEKEAKSVVLLRRRPILFLENGTMRPKSNILLSICSRSLRVQVIPNSTVSHFLLFQKRSKSVSSASQKAMGYPTLGEADPGGLGACPQ